MEHLMGESFEKIKLSPWDNNKPNHLPPELLKSCPQKKERFKDQKYSFACKKAGLCSQELSLEPQQSKSL